MRIVVSPACRAHRAALVDFVDRRELGPATDRALAHLGRCSDCESELEQVALAINALRRSFAEARRADPPDDAWPRLRGRVTRGPSRRGWASPASALMGAALVAMFVGPASFQTTASIVETPQGVADRLAYLPERGPGTSSGQRNLALVRQSLTISSPSQVHTRRLSWWERLERVGEAPAASKVTPTIADTLARRAR